MTLAAPSRLQCDSGSGGPITLSSRTQSPLLTHLQIGLKGGATASNSPYDESQNSSLEHSVENSQHSNSLSSTLEPQLEKPPVRNSKYKEETHEIHPTVTTQTIPENSKQQIPSSSPLISINIDYTELESELDKLEELHRNYQNSIHEANRLQNLLGTTIEKKFKRLKEIKSALSKTESHSEAETALKYQLEYQLEYRQHQLVRFQDGLPKTGELYLRVILGSFNVNLVEKDGRFKYKERYERFKLVLNLIIFVASLITLLFKYRALDAILHFILVWYHCTLTIRESILIANGSRIKGWWRAVQFITTIQAGVMIVWPDGAAYNEFRSQFLLYTIFTALLQCVQFYYQHNCLYRLRALGELYDMDVTIQGFHAWMWRGLSFLLPMLYAGYGFQFYNAYILYELYQRPNCHDWQVFASCLIYFIIFLGNTLTTTFVVQEKIRRGFSGKLRAFASRVKRRKDSLKPALARALHPHQD